MAKAKNKKASKVCQKNNKKACNPACKNKCKKNTGTQTIQQASKTTFSVPVKTMSAPLESGIMSVAANQPRQLAAKNIEVTPQKIVEEVGTTAQRLQQNATRLNELYTNYSNLRELAAKLNGLTPTAPLPADVIIDKVEFVFTVNSKTYTVPMAPVRAVGEVAAIIGNTLSSIMEQMYTEVFSLNSGGPAIQRAIERAIVSWKPASNADKVTQNEKTRQSLASV